MKLTRHSSNPILTKNPNQLWEAGSVFNATVIKEDDGLIRMLYRATNDVHADIAGKYVSSLGYAESRDGIHFERRPQPFIVPDQPYENGLGCEDASITKLGDTYYIYYTAVQGQKPNHKVRIALATTRDFTTVQKHGIVGPTGSRSKAAALLPEAVNGQYICYYTWEADRALSSIMHVRYDTIEQIIDPPQGLIGHSLENYDEYAVLRPEVKPDGDKVRGVVRGPELGPPPIKTDDGWLLIYCNTNTEDHREWQISAALLDINQPWKVVAQAPEPILRPEMPEEISGVVNHVTFPSGAVMMGEELYVYYGSGDQGVCLATCKLQELLSYLKQNRIT